MPQNDVQRTLTEAVREFSQNGFRSAEQLQFWIARLRRILTGQQQVSASQIASAVLRGVYRKAVTGGIRKYHPGISVRTIEDIEPRLRPILQARIFASADLIKLNREQAIETTLRRFSGWASAQTGSDTEVREAKAHIYKKLRQSSYEERRMMIDQGHKLLASINQTVAEGSGAIAVEWHSHWRQAGYDYRPDHKDRDGKIYLMRNSWAREQGFVKPGANGYYDDITHVAEEPYCRCFASYLYSLRQLPSDMLTQAGRDKIESVKNAISQ